MSDKKPDNGTDYTVTDALGRVLAIKTMGPAGMLDTIEAAGDQSGNAAWMRSAMVVAAVRSIDGIPVPVPITKQQIKAAAAQLGNEGFAAVAALLFGADQEADSETEAAIAKN